MLLLISGSVIATLNDDTNFQLRNTWELETAEYSSTRGYADCKEQLTIGITATTVTGVRTNIATLFKLQEDVAAWKQNQRTPVTMHYTPEGTNTTYRTLITDLKLTLPKDIHIAQTLRGIPNATLDYTRKGLWLSGSEGYYQTTSGVSGNVVTITGLSPQYVYSPTDISISGFLPDESSDPFFPDGYIFVADRTTTTQPAIVSEPASGLFGSVTTVGNASVAQQITTEVNIDNFYALRPAAMQLVNAYTKVHVYIVCSISEAYTAEIGLTSSAAIVSATYQQVSDPVYDSAASYTTRYVGTISKSVNYSFTDLRITITTDSTATISVYKVIFVADTDGTNIIKVRTDSGSLPVAYGGGRYEVQARNNYLLTDPTLLLRQISGFGAIPLVSGTLPYDGTVGDFYMQTKGVTVDMLASLSSVTQNSWWYLPGTGTTAHAQFLRLGLRRDKATLTPGI